MQFKFNLQQKKQSIRTFKFYDKIKLLNIAIQIKYKIFQLMIFLK